MGFMLEQEFVSGAGMLAGSLGFLMSALATFRAGVGVWPGRLRFLLGVVFLLSVAAPVATAAESRGGDFPWSTFIEMIGMGVVFGLMAGRAVSGQAENHTGFRWVLSGFWLLFLGTVAELAGFVGAFGGNVAVGEIADAVCRGCGLSCLGIGFFQWLPTIRALDQARAALQCHAESLEQEVERRTEELRDEVRQRREAEAAALESNASKSRFLANMSHELRTPLNAIIGFSDVLRLSEDRALPMAKICDYASDINGAGRHLLDIVNDVLDLAKVESGRMALAVEPFSLSSVINGASRIVEGKAVEGGIQLVVEDIEDIAIESDSRAVRQILLNLMSNAVKFTPPGGSVMVSTETVDGSVLVRVRDTGCGIPADQIERVFEPFEQVDNTYARAQGGTGLGLALCRRMASLMKGGVTLKSEVGVGTTATLRLPMGAAAVSAA